MDDKKVYGLVDGLQKALREQRVSGGSEITVSPDGKEIVIKLSPPTPLVCAFCGHKQNKGTYCVHCGKNLRWKPAGKLPLMHCVYCGQLLSQGNVTPDGQRCAGCWNLISDSLAAR